MKRHPFSQDGVLGVDPKPEYPKRLKIHGLYDWGKAPAYRAKGQRPPQGQSHTWGLRQAGRSAPGLLPFPHPNQPACRGRERWSYSHHRFACFSLKTPCFRPVTSPPISRLPQYHSLKFHLPEEEGEKLPRFWLPLPRPLLPPHARPALGERRPLRSRPAPPSGLRSPLLSCPFVLCFAAGPDARADSTREEGNKVTHENPSRRAARSGPNGPAVPGDVGPAPRRRPPRPRPPRPRVPAPRAAPATPAPGPATPAPPLPGGPRWWPTCFMNSRRGAGPGRPPARASPRGRACHPRSRSPGPATSSPRAGRAAAAVAGRASRSRAGAGRDALTRRRLQWRQRRRQQLQRRRQQRRLRWRRRQRGRGCATSANAGQAGRSTSRHAPRLRVAARRDGSHARVPVSRGRAGRAWAVTWACPVAPRGPPRRCASVRPRARSRSGGGDAAASWRVQAQTGAGCEPGGTPALVLQM